jgi:hypothetical protein
MRILVAILLPALLLVTPALAADGVREINQTCAVETGCIDDSEGIGDTPGFPVSIEIPGSYVLTSNLVVDDPNRDALFIKTSPVTIDLNGHELRGPVTCSGSGPTLSCGDGTGRGIRAEGFPRITVTNGSIQGFGSDGILVAGRSRVDGVVVERNGGSGIDAGSDSVVTESRAYRNGRTGIEVGDSAVIDDSTSASNRFDGIEAGMASRVTNSTARANGFRGIGTLGGSIEGCTVHGNASTGIRFGGRGLVAGNSVTSNLSGILVDVGAIVRGNLVAENEAQGIGAVCDTMIHANTVLDNGSWGLDLCATSTYRENTIAGNTDGSVDEGIDLGANACDGTAGCP